MTVDEGLAVEAKKSAVGSDPEVAVGCLRDAVYLATGEAIAYAPEGTEVLCQWAIGIERIGDTELTEEEKEDR